MMTAVTADARFDRIMSLRLGETFRSLSAPGPAPSHSTGKHTQSRQPTYTHQHTNALCQSLGARDNMFSIHQCEHGTMVCSKNVSHTLFVVSNTADMFGCRDPMCSGVLQLFGCRGPMCSGVLQLFGCRGPMCSGVLQLFGCRGPMCSGVLQLFGCRGPMCSGVLQLFGCRGPMCSGVLQLWSDNSELSPHFYMLLATWRFLRRNELMSSFQFSVFLY